MVPVPVPVWYVVLVPVVPVPVVVPVRTRYRCGTWYRYRWYRYRTGAADTEPPDTPRAARDPRQAPTPESLVATALPPLPSPPPSRLMKSASRLI